MRRILSVAALLLLTATATHRATAQSGSDCTSTAATFKIVNGQVTIVCLSDAGVQCIKCPKDEE